MRRHDRRMSHDINDALEAWRWRVQTEEAFAYARLPNGGGCVFIGELDTVRENVTLLIGMHGESEIPVVIIRNTDDNVRQLRALLDEGRTHEDEPSKFNAVDEAVLERVYRDFPAMGRNME